MNTNIRSLHDRRPREVVMHTQYGRLAFLEQLARMPSGKTKMVRWRGTLNGAPVDRERLDMLVLAHAIDAELAG
jgi:hypothetical protein